MGRSRWRLERRRDEDGTEHTEENGQGESDGRLTAEGESLPS
ncbi:MAG: hypothetical protein ACTHLH_07715 [Solirubrobacterales bacterium]